MEQLSVAMVIVHWRNMADTAECLRALAAVDYPRLGVVLVSNGSPDMDDQVAREAFAAVTIVRSEANLGFAGGNNLGIQRALEDDYDLVMLLNPDTVVRPELIYALLPPLADPTVGIVGPTIVYYDAPERVWFAGGRFSRLLGYGLHPGMNRPVVIEPGARRVDFINGCALLARRQVFERIGGLWEPFFLYFEEADFCLRAARAGLGSALVGQPLVLHKVSASTGQRGSNAFGAHKAYYFGRNPFLLLRRNAHGLWAATALVSQFIVVLPYYLWRGYLTLPVLRDYIEGLWDGLRGRSGPRPSPQRRRS